MSLDQLKQAKTNRSALRKLVKPEHDQKNHKSHYNATFIFCLDSTATRNRQRHIHASSTTFTFIFTFLQARLHVSPSFCSYLPSNTADITVTEGLHEDRSKKVGSSFVTRASSSYHDDGRYVPPKLSFTFDTLLPVIFVFLLDTWPLTD
ncbi:hypothetical protein I316_01880 [Kwoniella heveanensis BCC8398]|uniref:Uncharacterized protein n=1 Tax=Kwoniella heveanensis BCC8398 TaxID=1296120 RepID=A0A1B9H015_9TREE|nr:hypothetical protein I316_01880 [Kwoniella heveanensis BCC8398]